MRYCVRVTSSGFDSCVLVRASYCATSSLKAAAARTATGMSAPALAVLLE
jgi:hypothetical protein